MARPPARERPGPGGVDDGLPQEPGGAPLLHRWFAIAMVILVPIGLAVGAWAFFAIPGSSIEPAARRPPGTDAITHERGEAALNRIRNAEDGPGCARGVTIVGDESARSAIRRALEGVCSVLEEGAPARRGLDALRDRDGSIRMAVFELTGVDSSTRLEDGAPVIELNAKFQFEPGRRAAPAIVHELVHLADGMPGEVVTAQAELEAVRAQAEACRGPLDLGDDPPRGCGDAQELLGSDDPLGSLVRAGYPIEEHDA